MSPDAGRANATWNGGGVCRSLSVTFPSHEIHEASPTSEDILNE